MLSKDLIYTSQNLSDLLAKCRGANPEMDVRRAKPQVTNEYIAQSLVIVLSGMNGQMLAMIIEHPHYLAKADYLRPRAEYRHYFHIMMITRRQLRIGRSRRLRTRVILAIPGHQAWFSQMNTLPKGPA